MNPELRILHAVPPALLAASSDALLELLGGPTLIHLEGERQDRLFVSTLLHGNEDTGWLAIRKLLAKYAAVKLPRSLTIFIGNVEAARWRLRRLDHQPDYNRIWPGTSKPDLPESALMRAVVSEMEDCSLFASVDIHNNTGTNPHYACITLLEDANYYLATLFGRTVVYFRQPLGTQTSAFSARCPAVALECGKPGSIGSVEHALQFLEACLHLQAFPAHPFPKHDIDLFHTVATVKVCEHTTFGFGPGPGVLKFDPALDQMNFRELKPGTSFGSIDGHASLGLRATNGHGQDVTEQYFARRDNLLVTKRFLMPAMLTCDAKIIRQDCLCYLMERKAC
ncbi:MAG: M14 family metallopeptidase [Nitrosomonas halophila]